MYVILVVAGDPTKLASLLFPVKPVLPVFLYMAAWPFPSRPFLDKKL